MDRRLTVIICTHNREQLLRKCVESLLQQSVPENRFEILIVDNASRDGTAACIAEYAGKYDFITAVHEARVGLSHARNTGLEHAAGEWIAYLDDDGSAHTDWVARLLEHVEAGEFDAVGGLYLPHFESAPPAWYLDRYNSNSWMLREGVPVYEIRAGDPHFSGGNCGYRRAALIEIGGFSPELGMRGDRMAYSEEVELQDRLLERGYRLAFDADLRMDHDTPRYKQKLGWFIRKSFVQGRDRVRVDRRRQRGRWARTMQTGLRGGVGAFKSELRAIAHSLQQWRRGSYRWQNVLIDVSEPIVHYLGKLYGLVVVR